MTNAQQLSVEERLIIGLQQARERHPNRWFPLSSLPGPTYLAERELEMAEKRDEVESRDFDGTRAWRATA